MSSSAYEVIFEESLQFLPDRYRDRLDLSRFEIPELSSALGNIKSTLNAIWAPSAARIITPDGSPSLHLDYIASSIVNAITYSYKGIYFVAITDKLLVQMAKAALAISRLTALEELLQIQLTEANKDYLFQVIFMLQLQFVCAHELGHLFHGHNDRSALYEEFSRTPALAPSVDQLKRQACETEADGYATKFLLENFLLTGSGQQIHQRTGSLLSREECILTLILISAGAVFLCLPFSKFTQETAATNHYPFGLARLNEVLLQIIPWCEENQPGLEKWASLYNFQWVMACVQEAAGNSAQREDWMRQSQFLDAPNGDGEQYLKDLHRAQEELRREMASSRWFYSKSPQVAP